jgi:hypothetical protein
MVGEKENRLLARCTYSARLRVVSGAKSRKGDNMNTLLSRLINDSIRENRIVRVSFHDAMQGGLYDDILDASEDTVLNGTEREFWGTDEDGDQWRIHVTEIP